MANKVRPRNIRKRSPKQGLVEVKTALEEAADAYIAQLPRYERDIARRFVLEFYPDGETLDEMGFLQWYFNGKPRSAQQNYESLRKKGKLRPKKGKK